MRRSELAAQDVADIAYRALAPYRPCYVRRDVLCVAGRIAAQARHRDLTTLVNSYIRPIESMQTTSSRHLGR